MTADKPTVIIYTDGACDPNPGPGGWAAILRAGRRERELSGGETDTTNNRMELQAVIEALNVLKRPCKVKVFTDSEYLQLGITSRLSRWQANGWRTQSKQPVANQDLWQALIEALQPHEIEWSWVKGHAEDDLNRRADRLARAAIPRTDIADDDPHAVQLYAGASSRAPGGPGGWAAVILSETGEREIGGRVEAATANQLQLLAVARGLETLPERASVRVHTPSDYVHQGATKWLRRWRRKGWTTKDGQPVKNRAAWEELAAAADRRSVHWQRSDAQENVPSAQRARALAGEYARARESPAPDHGK